MQDFLRPALAAVRAGMVDELRDVRSLGSAADVPPEVVARVAAGLFACRVEVGRQRAPDVWISKQLIIFYFYQIDNIIV